MNRVCIHKTTGRLLEMQQGGDDREDLMEMRLNTLKQNAINAGYKEEDIEAKWVDDKELAVLTAPTAEEISAQEALAVKAKLTEIDLQSLRSIREYIAKQADAPKFLKDYEAQATAERAKIKQ